MIQTNGRNVQVAILAPEGAKLASIGALLDTFAVLNNLMRLRVSSPDLAPPAASLTVVTPGGGPLRLGGGIVINGTDPAPGTIYDLIFVPSFNVPLDDDLLDLGAPDLDQIGWLRDQFRRGAAIAASGSGTFLLAQGGLLNGRNAAVPWWANRLFHLHFPKVAISAESLVVEDGRIATATGHPGEEALLIRIVSWFFPAETVAWLCRVLGFPPAVVRSIVKTSDNWLASEDPLVMRIQRVLHERAAQPMSMSILANTFGVSERTLLRHFKASTGMTPLAYLHRIRIEIAKYILIKSKLSINLVANAVGYNDVRFFRTIFKREAGVTPGHYRARLTT